MTFQKTACAVYAWTDSGLALFSPDKGYIYEYRRKDGRWSVWGFRP